MTMDTGFRKGDLILTEKPFAYVLNNDYRKFYCDFCCKKNDQLRRCSQCTFVKYCDKQCQKGGWMHHKKECKYMKRIDIISGGDDQAIDILVLLARVVFMCKETKISQAIGTYTRTYDDLESHFEEMNKHRMGLIGLIKMLKSYIGAENVPSEDEVIKMYGKIRINILGIYGPETPGIIGSGLYLGASIFDHDCDPDCVAFFRGHDIYVRAMRDIPTRDFKKITIRYRGSLFPTKQRQEDLRKEYFFTCQCERCTKPEFDEYLTKVLDESKAANVIKLSEKTEEQLLIMRATGANSSLKLKTIENCLKQQEGVLADGHYLRFQLLGDAMNLCTHVKKYHKSIEYGIRSLEPIKKVWGENTGDVITRLYRLGELYIIIRNMKKSREMFRQAYEASCQLYGPDDEFSMKVKKRIS